MADRITLHRSLYRRAAIRSTAAAFAGLARVEVVEEEAETTVTFDDVDPDVHETLSDAFANHALAETVRLHRAAVGEDHRDAEAGVG